MEKISRFLIYLHNFYLSRCCYGGWRVYLNRNNDKYEWIDPCYFDKNVSTKDKAVSFHSFMADPFLFHTKGHNWLFFETVGPEVVQSGLKGKIGCLKEVGGRWVNQGVVLEQPWHMSYPQVFEENGHIYMIPEQSALGKGDVSLYEATDFPRGWEKRVTLIERPFADATLLRLDGHYYMACYTIPPSETAELWHATSLFGPWTRHPEWQNILQNAKFRRCGGAFLEENGRLFRMAQDCDGGYGLRLYKVPVIEVTPEKYKEGKPILFMDEQQIIKSYKHTFNKISGYGEQLTVFDCHWHTRMPFIFMLNSIFERIVIKLKIR